MKKTKNVISPGAIDDAALSLYFQQPHDHFHLAQPDAVNHADQGADVRQHRRVDDATLRRGSPRRGPAPKPPAVQMEGMAWCFSQRVSLLVPQRYKPVAPPRPTIFVTVRNPTRPGGGNAWHSRRPFSLSRLPCGGTP